MRTIHEVATASIYGELTILQAGTGRTLVIATVSPTTASGAGATGSPCVEKPT